MAKLFLQVIELKRSFSSFDDEEAPRVSVFCHGNLSAETIEFNAIGEIIAINDWEVKERARTFAKRFLRFLNCNFCRAPFYSLRTLATSPAIFAR